VGQTGLSKAIAAEARKNGKITHSGTQIPAHFDALSVLKA